MMNFNNQSLRPTWVEFDLSAVRYNIRQLKTLLGPQTSIYVCLKGDGNGVGAIAVAVCAQEEGVAGFTFGNIDSALQCREAGIVAPILLYTSCLPETAAILVRNDIMATISTLDDVVQWDRSTEAPLSVFLKIDGGGWRAGAFPENAAEVAFAISQSEHLTLAGVYGHPMSNYDFCHDDKYTLQQIQAIRLACDMIEKRGINIGTTIISSSSIILEYPSADMNAVDPGRLIVGMPFNAILERSINWRPALVGLKSKLVMVKSTDNIENTPSPPFWGETIPTKLGLVPFGWSDGYPRSIPKDKNITVLIRGKRARLLPPCHSEMLRIDLSDIHDAQIGDEVAFLGYSGDECITLEELANQWDMSIQDVYYAISKNIHRVYNDEY